MLFATLHHPGTYFSLGKFCTILNPKTRLLGAKKLCISVERAVLGQVCLAVGHRASNFSCVENHQKRVWAARTESMSADQAVSARFSFQVWTSYHVTCLLSGPCNSLTHLQVSYSSLLSLQVLEGPWAFSWVIQESMSLENSPASVSATKHKLTGLWYELRFGGASANRTFRLEGRSVGVFPILKSASKFGQFFFSRILKLYESGRSPCF